MTARRLVWIVPTALVLLVAIGVLGFTLLGAEPCRRWLIAEIEAASGRDADIEAMRLNLFTWRPGLLAEGVTVGNPSWAKSPTMLSVERVNIELDLRALFDRTIRIYRLSLQKPRLSLEQTADGVGNWRFERKPRKPNQTPWVFDLREVDIHEADATWRRVGRDQVHRIAIDQLSFERGGARTPLRTKLVAVVDGKPLSLTGQMTVHSADLRDADIQLAVDRLKVRDRTFTHLDVRIAFAKRRVVADPVKWFDPSLGGTLTAKIVFVPEPGRNQAQVHVEGKSLSLAGLLNALGYPVKISGASTDVAADLRAQGGSWRAMIASLDGELRAQVGEGRFAGDKLDFGEGFLAKLFDNVLPQDSGTVLRCAAARVPVEDGVIRSNRNVALETDKITLAASGEISLGNKTLRVLTKTSPKRGIFSGMSRASNMVEVAGTFDEPRIHLNPKGVAMQGVSLGTAAATGGVSLLYEDLARRRLSRDPCKAALEAKAPKERT